MSRIDVPAFGNEEFWMGPVEGVLPSVRFTGTGDMEAAGELSQFLSLLHEAVMQSQAKNVVFDITELYFMNSSCLKELVVWINKLNTQGRPYTVSFRTNPRLKWQSRSLSTLQRLAPAVVHLESAGSEP